MLYKLTKEKVYKLEPGGSLKYSKFKTKTILIYFLDLYTRSSTATVCIVLVSMKLKCRDEKVKMLQIEIPKGKLIINSRQGTQLSPLCIGIWIQEGTNPFLFGYFGWKRHANLLGKRGQHTK